MGGDTRIRILYADDHFIVREGLRAIVSAQPDMEVVGEATTGSEAIELYRQHRPDVMVLDLRMPNVSGHDVLQRLVGEDRKARIIVLTSYDADEHIHRALQAGAKGYLFKDLVRTELLAAIRTVYAGRNYMPAQVANRIPQLLVRNSLTPREIDVLTRAAAGLSNKEIAAQMRISDLTVKAHLQSVFVKLNARDRTHAVTLALRQGMIEL